MSLSARLPHAKFLPFLAMLFIGWLLTTNLITPKVVPLGHGVICSAGDFFFPFSYALSLLVTEVYGYGMSRYMVWSAIAVNLVAILMIVLALNLPADKAWPLIDRAAYNLILWRAPRTLIASLVSFGVGEFLGSYILAKLKLKTKGQKLGVRVIAASILGQAFDSYLFTLIAFLGHLTSLELIKVGMVAFTVKMFCQVVLTPLVCYLARYLKRAEGLNAWSQVENFNPFILG